jgi:GT2 family glycosyltransferase
MFRWRRKSAPARVQPDIGPVYALIRAWNRPLHLWACLDSLFRATGHPCRFVLVDNGSTDPLVRTVVRGFERREMFRHVSFLAHNDAANQIHEFARHRPEMGRYTVLIDGDVVVERAEPDWLTQMLLAMEADPRLGVLGSAIDRSDFVSPDWARARAGSMPEAQVAQLIKAHSPERRPIPETADVVDPFPPAGRLLVIRTDVIDRVGLPIGNHRLCNAVREAGYRVGILPTVRHRHLSLLNFFDYQDYDFQQLDRYLQRR